MTWTALYIALGAWLVLSMPLAWLVGRFIHKGATMPTVASHAETDN